MKAIAITTVILVFVSISSGVCLAYDVANALQFPLETYVKKDNVFGSYNFIGNSKYHLGEDADAKATTKVFAIGNGKVMKAKIHTGYGGMYVIEHTMSSGQKFCSLYAHLNFATFAKKEGDDVGKGEYLGEIGTVSQNGGWPEHLHFGILKGGYPGNPDAYVCGDWILSGYTACKDILVNWHNPSSFINNLSTALFPVFRVGNVAWFPPNASCTRAERWWYFQPNTCTAGTRVYSNSICEQEKNSIIQTLGLGTDWWQIIYGTGDIDQYKTCGR